MKNLKLSDTTLLTENGVHVCEFYGRQEAENGVKAINNYDAMRALLVKCSDNLLLQLRGTPATPHDNNELLNELKQLFDTIR